MGQVHPEAAPGMVKTHGDKLAGAAGGTPGRIVQQAPEGAPSSLKGHGDKLQAAVDRASSAPR